MGRRWRSRILAPREALRQSAHGVQNEAFAVALVVFGVTWYDAKQVFIGAGTLLVTAQNTGEVLIDLRFGGVAFCQNQEERAYQLSATRRSEVCRCTVNPEKVQLTPDISDLSNAHLIERSVRNRHTAGCSNWDSFVESRRVFFSNENGGDDSKAATRRRLPYLRRRCG